MNVELIVTLAATAGAFLLAGLVGLVLPQGKIYRIEDLGDLSDVDVGLPD